MQITLELQPEIERGLVARAQAKGISLSEFVQEIVLRESQSVDKDSNRTGQELVQIGEKVRGLFSDEEVDSLFA